MSLHRLESSAPVIRANNIKKQFDGRHVLAGVNLRLAAGKTHVLLGSSGSGKSTLLRLMLGLIDSDHGEIEVSGTRACKTNQPEIARKSGYVVQGGGLFLHLTAKQNALLPFRTIIKESRPTRGSMHERLHQLTNMVNLDDALLDKYPAQLSGGENQRIALVRALMLDPDILFFDEPLSALDPIIRARLQQDLKQIFSKLKKTVVMVTHDTREAASLGDTISLLHQGRILQHGTYSELARRPTDPFVADFIAAQSQGEAL